MSGVKKFWVFADLSLTGDRMFELDRMKFSILQNSSCQAKNCKHHLNPALAPGPGVGWI